MDFLLFPGLILGLLPPPYLAVILLVLFTLLCLTAYAILSDRKKLTYVIILFILEFAGFAGLYALITSILPSIAIIFFFGFPVLFFILFYLNILLVQKRNKQQTPQNEIPSE